MITCHYCGFSHEAFRPTCSVCGAPLRGEQSATTVKTETESVLEKIQRVCRQNIIMYNIPTFQKGDSIPEKKLGTIIKYFTVFPNGKEIYFYCDTSPLNNGKQGLMICEDGIYWQNSWVTPTSRNFISWEKLKEREIVVLKK